MIGGSSWQARLNEVSAVLEAERRLLMQGKIEAIAAMDKRREAAIARLENLPPDADDDLRAAFRVVQRRAERNQRLLAAYLRGAQAATVRIAEISRGETRIGAYCADGSMLDGQLGQGASQTRA